MEVVDSWILTEGVFVKGKIMATVPMVTDFDPENLSYLVDVALNGQQFTGKPVNFRYYDVKIQQVEPPLGPSIGGTNIKVLGRGLYDAGIKRIRISTADGKGKREVTAEWDKKYKCLRCTIPAFRWLFAEEDQTIEDDEQEEKKKAPLVKKSVEMKLTLNNQEWIDALHFSYHDAEISRISYANQIGAPDASAEEREQIWNSEEPEENLHEDMPEEERKKKDDERAKKVAEENEEVNTLAKRKGNKILIHGANFARADALMLRFSLEGFSPVLVRPIFKN